MSSQAKELCERTARSSRGDVPPKCVLEAPGTNLEGAGHVSEGLCAATRLDEMQLHFLARFQQEESGAYLPANGAFGPSFELNADDLLPSILPWLPKTPIRVCCCSTSFATKLLPHDTNFL
jgi:hypothetical protein